MTERYTREGEALVLEVATIDTFFLTDPWIFKVRSTPDPEPLDLPWNCDLDATRQILKILPTSYPDDPAIDRIEQ